MSGANPLKSMNCVNVRALFIFGRFQSAYISRLTQDLEFILRVSNRNTMTKNGQDEKKAYEILPESVAMPF
jgi:hypothetical protein